MNFAKVLRTPFLQNTSGRLLLYGIETVSYRVAFLWANLLSEYNTTTSLNEFKTINKKKMDSRNISL